MKIVECSLKENLGEVPHMNELGCPYGKTKVIIVIKIAIHFDINGR